MQVKNSFFWVKDKKRFARIDGVFCELITERKKTIKRKSYSVFSAKKINKNDLFYIVGMGDLWAHGKTLKEAFEDVEFKIISEKLKNDPISKDTIITVNHYRAVTGACRLGCADWMERNGIKGENIKAKDLLPILEKTNAFGLERFRKLIKF